MSDAETALLAQLDQVVNAFLPGTRGATPVQIVGIDGGDIVVVPRADLGIVTIPRLGAPVRLAWGADRSWHELLTKLVKTEPADGANLPRWRLQPTGVLDLFDRRRYHRLQVAAPVRLTRPHRGDLPPVLGMTADIGDGGTRCRFPASAELTVGESVLLEILIDGETFPLPGSVLRILSESGPRDVVVAFADPVLDGVTVRRLSLRAQVFSRKSTPR